ncbi:MAG: glutamine--fructose-6-phosphate transaminase (isomerizing) [Chloroflexi bacterium]|nr:glutamine--fructose-6-phosphate transaminase (isomerizing) [Chloroflexota bacterium]
MCGIIGYIGGNDAASIIYSGLQRLEYRGYDSSGIAILNAGAIDMQRATGKLANLLPKLTHFQATHSSSNKQVGIGHTRWATHGGISEANAHPHLNQDGTIAVIQNGIIENYVELHTELQQAGVRFHSETDTEVVPHLLDLRMRSGMNFEQAAFAVLRRLRGANALVMMCTAVPGRMIAARLGHAGGVAIGHDEATGEAFLASDVPGILEHVRRVTFLEDGEVALIDAWHTDLRKLDGTTVQRSAITIAWDPVSAEKGEYRHFMQKEIHEQARAVTDTLRGRVNFESGEVTLNGFDGVRPTRIFSVACGTSKNSALVGRFFFESIARIPTEVDYGSEFRYRDPLLQPGEVVLGITQSGETADTLAAMSEGRNKGARVWSIVNSVGSQAERAADATIAMRTGPEIGVCSTKTFLASLVDQYMLACFLAQRSSDASIVARGHECARALALLPGLVGRMLDVDPIYEQLAQRFHDRRHFLFLGRGPNYPIALEGALKLKEVSYIHAEGYPAGEMKHGPIALIDEHMPVVCLTPQDSVYAKMVSQVEQVRARGGTVIAVITRGDEVIRAKADHVIEIPPAPELLLPMLTAIPMQRLAYHMALRLGCDVDQPRNLAKSVTVE